MKNIFSPSKFFYSFVEEHLSKYRHLAKGRLVDVGCGQKPFRHLFENIDSYYGVDIGENSQADLICDVLDLKIEDDSADSVLCTQVLEHVNEPNTLISEISRICRKEAVVLLTAPHISRIHLEPYDFFRFTKYGLKHLFEKNGFEIIAIEEMGGFFLTMAYLTNFYLRKKLGPFSYAVNPVINLLYVPIRYIDKNKNHAFNYLVVAKKI